MCAHAPLAGAQPASAQPASPEAASAESTARAAEIKKRGDDAIDTGRPADTLAAYVEAYGLTKDPALLYNKGRALQGLGEYPQTLEELEAFEKAAPPELRARVPGLAKQLSDLRNRVTTVSIACDTMGARVRFRDRSLGKCPLPEKLRIASGRGTLDVLADGYFPYVREVDLADGGAASLDVHLASMATIKFLMPDALTTHDGVARFEREARAAALLRSPHVVRVLDVDATTDGLPFIVMEYLEGHDLASELRMRNVIPTGEAVDLSKAGSISRRRTRPSERRTTWRRSSCSPRRPSIIASMSGRWASCFIACWLAGSMPFVGATPTALAEVVARALQKDPARRFWDVIELGRALEPFGTRRVAFSAAVAGVATRAGDDAVRARRRQRESHGADGDGGARSQRARCISDCSRARARRGRRDHRLRDPARACGACEVDIRSRVDVVLDKRRGERCPHRRRATSACIRGFGIERERARDDRGCGGCGRHIDARELRGATRKAARLYARGMQSTSATGSADDVAVVGSTASMSAAIDATLDANDAAARDASSTPPTPGRVDCKSGSCDLSAGETCCFSQSMGTGNCLPAGATCPAGTGLTITCDGDEDCNGGRKCCFIGTAGSQCGGTGAGGCNTYPPMCHSTNTCSPGTGTCTGTGLGYYRICAP